MCGWSNYNNCIVLKWCYVVLSSMLLDINQRFLVVDLLNSGCDNEWKKVGYQAKDKYMQLSENEVATKTDEMESYLIGVK